MTKFIAWGQRVLPSTEMQPPGNSLAIIDTAYAHGYDGIELDLRLTADGVLVLMHDDAVDKTTLGTGRISQMTAEEATALRLLDPHEGPTHFVPTFAQALIINGDRGYVMVDLRRLDKKAEQAIAAAVRISGFDPRLFMFLAYSPEAGLRYQELYPESIVMLKAPINLRPPELTAAFVDSAGDIGSVIAPIVAHPETIAEFRDRCDALGKTLGIFLHHQGIKTLREVVGLKPDFITSMNPRDFDAIRAEFGLTRGPALSAQPVA